MGRLREKIRELVRKKRRKKEKDTRQEDFEYLTHAMQEILARFMIMDKKGETIEIPDDVKDMVEFIEIATIASMAVNRFLLKLETGEKDRRFERFQFQEGDVFGLVIPVAFNVWDFLVWEENEYLTLVSDGRREVQIKKEDCCIHPDQVEKLNTIVTVVLKARSE